MIVVPAEQVHDVVVECAASVPGRIRISIRDTGAGLPPEKLAQLFQPFNRLGQEQPLGKHFVLLQARQHIGSRRNYWSCRRLPCECWSGGAWLPLLLRLLICNQCDRL